MESLHDLKNAHWGHEPMRSAEPLLGADLPDANAPCWKPALRVLENVFPHDERDSSGRLGEDNEGITKIKS